MDVDHWTPYNNDPNGIVAAVNGPDGTGLNLLNASSGNQGSYYLDTHWSVTAERFSLNSAAGYINGMTQTDILNGVTIDETATYDLSFDLEYAFNTVDTTITVALTVGANSTDPGTAVTGSLFSQPVDFLTSGDTQSVSISGADLKAAQDSGDPVNLIVQSLNNQAIPGFPGGTVVPNDHATTAIVSQLRLDNFSLAQSNFAAGDVNKDGVINQGDVNLAQLYHDGNGGDTAAVRQSTLSGSGNGNTDADILASLNLSDFDLVAPFDIFDQADVDAIAALVPGGIVGDYDDSGTVAQGDLDIVLLNWGSGTFPGNAANIPGGGPFDGSVSQNELDGVLLNWGNTVAAVAAVPEPTSLLLVGMALSTVPFLGRRRS